MSMETPRTEGEITEGRQLFRALIRGAAANPCNRTSVLTDSHHQCLFPEIPTHLESIQNFLAVHQVNPGDCVALEINNSVRGALSTLALLDAGYSFMTLPTQGQGAQAGGNALVPANFCRWVLSVNTEEPTDVLLASDSYLKVRTNPGFDAASTIPSEASPRLFFRTSGSLGTAKLAVFNYRRFHGNTLVALEYRQFNPSHRIALPTPIFHLYGLGAGLLAGVAGGASIDLQERSNILKYLERERAFNPNVAYVTPAFCETLIRGRRSPRHYRFMVTGGDRISNSTFRRCEELHGPMVNQYGTTEMGVISASDLNMSHELRSQTVGRPGASVEYRIVKLPDDADSNSGELQIRHAYGFEGYVDLNGQKLVPDNAFDGDWYRTGDLAMPGPDGTLRVLGRCDLSVNRNGVLLPLADVESRFRELEGVEEVAVALGPDTIRGRALVAFCVLSREANLTSQQLRAVYAAKAPPYSVPDAVHLLAALPKLGSGKVDRQSLTRLAERLLGSTIEA